MLRLVVDTAANGYLILDSGEAARLGLREDIGGVKRHAKGLGTSAHSMSKLEIPSLLMGDAEIHSPPCIAMDLSAVMEAGGAEGLHGLLGSDFLSRHAAIIDFETMRLSFRAEAGPPIETG